MHFFVQVHEKQKSLEDSRKAGARLVCCHFDGEKEGFLYYKLY